MGVGQPKRAVGTRGLHAGPRAEGPGTAMRVRGGLGAASLDPGRTLAPQRSPGPWTGRAVPRPVPRVCGGPLGVISRVAFHTRGQQHGDDPVHKGDAHPSRLHRCACQVCPLKAAPPKVGTCVDDGDPPGAAGALTSACSHVTNRPSPTVLIDVCVPTSPTPGWPAGASSRAPGATGRLLKPHPHQPQVNPSAAHWQRRAPGPHVQSRTGTHDKAATHPGPSRRQGGRKLLGCSFRLKTLQNIKRVSALWRCLFRW